MVTAGASHGATKSNKEKYTLVIGCQKQQILCLYSPPQGGGDPADTVRMNQPIGETLNMSSVLDGVNRLTQLVGRNRLELLMFRLGSAQRFGINVFKVREVIKCPPLTKAPHAHPVVAGMANIRGRVVTVIDLSAAVGMPSIKAGQGNSVIITEYNRHVQGFLVSQVERIVNKIGRDTSELQSR